MDRLHRGPRFVLTVVSLTLVAACATTGTRPEPAPTAELVRRFVLDYEHVPPVPAEAAGEVGSAWAAMRSGDAATARDILDAVAAGSPSRDAAEGLLLLARGATGQARTRFQGALASQPGFAPALYGLGFAAESEGDRLAGLDWYRRAVEADPTMSTAAVRLQVLRLEQAQALIADGEQAEARGDDDAALSSYNAALELAPDLLEPYLRIAALQRAARDNDSAVSTLRAARDRIGDLRVVLEPLGRALQDAGAYAEAYDVFQALQAVAPDDAEVNALLVSARELYFTTSLPEPYRELENKPEITREDLAALIAIRLGDLGELVDEPRTGVIIVDIEDSWAADYIREIVSWDIMQLFQNHAFGPELVVKRQYFAEVAYRVLELLGAAEEAPGVRLTDVPREHYFYDEIRVVVGQGILDVGPRGTFGLLETVSGAEAVTAVQRLVRLARGRIDR